MLKCYYKRRIFQYPDEVDIADKLESMVLDWAMIADAGSLRCSESDFGKINSYRSYNDFPDSC